MGASDPFTFWRPAITHLTTLWSPFCCFFQLKFSGPKQNVFTRQTFKVKIKNYVSTDKPVSLVSCGRRWTKMQGLIPAVLQHMFIQQTIMISIKDFPKHLFKFSKLSPPRTEGMWSLFAVKDDVCLYANQSSCEDTRSSEETMLGARKQGYSLSWWFMHAPTRFVNMDQY